MDLLSKGLKYRMPPKAVPLREIVVNVEAVLETASLEKKMVVRSEVKGAINSNIIHRKNLDEWEILKSLQDKDVIYSNPDKGKKEYKEYKSRMQFPVDKLQERVTEKLKELTVRGLISERESWKLKVANPRMPRMSGLPKM